MSPALSNTDIDPRSVIDGLLTYIDASPSPYHACHEASETLKAHGFVELHRRDHWPSGPGKWFVTDGGALVAWVVGDLTPQDAPFRLVGAHTDSPNLRVKARPDTGRAGWRQLGVEVYGGALVNSWLDRDLGISGRVTIRMPDHPQGFETRLLKVDEPLLRVPQLAIHLDREINDKGLQLNRQNHLVPVWGLGPIDQGGFVRFVADQLDIDAGDVLAWDLMLHDLTPSTVGGVDQDLIFAPRLDNLLSCYVALDAITRLGDGPPDSIPVIALFDHEEIGSESATGASGTLLSQVIERIVVAAGGDRTDLLRALAGSVCVSSDMAHATHPNYPERHEPDHHITIDGGPVIKINANQRYASDATTVAQFQLACDAVNVPTQRYIHRTDMACGSTIGPITAAGLAIPTVDVGVAQLSMHSAREVTGVVDPVRMVAALGAFLSPSPS